jgi:hypothetical protein
MRTRAIATSSRAVATGAESAVALQGGTSHRPDQQPAVTSADLRPRDTERRAVSVAAQRSTGRSGPPRRYRTAGGLGAPGLIVFSGICVTYTSPLEYGCMASQNLRARSMCASCSAGSDQWRR